MFLSILKDSLLALLWKNAKHETRSIYRHLPSVYYLPCCIALTCLAGLVHALEHSKLLTTSWHYWSADARSLYSQLIAIIELLFLPWSARLARNVCSFCPKLVHILQLSPLETSFKVFWLFLKQLKEPLFVGCWSSVASCLKACFCVARLISETTFY